MRWLYSLILESPSRSSLVGAVGPTAGVQTGCSGRCGGSMMMGGDIGPPKKEKSVVIDDVVHGTCAPLVAVTTPRWVLLNACSAVVPGARISRISSVTNSP